MTNLDTTLETLALLARSGSRVIVGYTRSDGSAHRELYPMSAEDAITYVTATADIVSTFGLTARFTLTRWEG